MAINPRTDPIASIAALVRGKGPAAAIAAVQHYANTLLMSAGSPTMKLDDKEREILLTYTAGLFAASSTIQGSLPVPSFPPSF